MDQDLFKGFMYRLQVLVASFRNRKLPLPDDPAELYEIDKDKEAATEAEFLPHRDIYRLIFLLSFRFFFKHNMICQGFFLSTAS